MENDATPDLDEEETSDGEDDDTETIEGEIEDLRGPFADGSAEIDVRKTDGELVTVTLSSGQVAQLLGEEPPKAN